MRIVGLVGMDYGYFHVPERPVTDPTSPRTPLTELPAWAGLTRHHAEIAPKQLRDLFAADPERGTRFSLEAEGIYLDYSKNRIDDETLGLLVQLAEQAGLRARIDAMFAGEKINITEDRAVLHVA
ncbi:MAG: hypothetical protein M3Y06_09800, partial [Actinomycetota bacterium]|nr:hypothetical protein [Actinomycetota bacterium]